MNSTQPNVEAVGNGKDIIDTEYPGTEIVLKIGVHEFTYVVVPTGIAHFSRFTSAIGRAVQSFARLDMFNKMDTTGKIVIDPQMISLFASIAVDIVTRDLMELVLDCTVPRRIPIIPVLDDRGQPAINQPPPPVQPPHPNKLKHWHLPLLVEAWIHENFGSEEQIRPWVQVVERAIQRFAGRAISIWEPLSKHLSPAAIRAVISSTDGSVPSSEPTSHIPVGQSRKSSRTTGKVSAGSSMKEPIE